MTAICVICTRRETRTGMVCDPDRLRLARTLDEIVDLYGLLPEQLAPGQSTGERVSGSREAPLPLRVDPLDLMMPAPTGRQLWTTVSDPLGDQVGQLPVASVLDSWIRDWRDVRGQGEAAPVPTVMTLAHWLSARLDWACEHHAAVDEFWRELHDLLGALRRTAGVLESQPELCDGVACSGCDLRALFRHPGSAFRAECGGCGKLYSEDEYTEWLGLLAAAEKRNAA